MFPSRGHNIHELHLHVFELILPHIISQNATSPNFRIFQQLIGLQKRWSFGPFSQTLNDPLVGQHFLLLFF